MTATVDIKSVTHRFGDFTALSDINLTIEAGSFAVLLGPSGCGKTTLLSILGGFLHPSEGSVFINGKDLTHVAPAKRPTTTMFQDYALFPHLSLLDNVGFGLRMRGQRKKQRHTKAAELLALVGLENESKKKPHELSGGQRQRVALARALAVDPDVLLLDEPLGALDLKLRRQMQDELKSIQRRLGTTFVHVTHDQEEAMAIADSIIVLNAGVVEDAGTPEKIYLNPASLFSATFMGETNQLRGIIQSDDSHELSIYTSLGLLTVANQLFGNSSIAVKNEVTICFRPEHVYVHDSTSNTENREDTNFIELGAAKVADCAFFGSHQRCQLMAANGQTIVAQLPQTQSVHTGQELTFYIDRSSVVVLENYADISASPQAKSS